MKNHHPNQLVIPLLLLAATLVLPVSAQAEEVLGVWSHTWTANMPVTGMKTTTITFNIKEGGKAVYTVKVDKVGVHTAKWKRTGNMIAVTLDEKVGGEALAINLLWDGKKLCYQEEQQWSEPKCFLRDGTPMPSGTASGNTGPSAGFYRGFIGGKYEIVMILTVRSTDRVLKGDYHYTSKNQPIALTGTYDLNNRFTLTEEVDGKITGTFTGTAMSDTLTGEWRSPDGKRKLPFSVQLMKK